MLHSGKLWLDTENSDNSFVLTLPLAQEKVRQQENSVIQEEFIFPEEGTTVNVESRNYTLLLVEDNDTMRSFLAEKLQEMFVMETAPDGKAALEILRNQHIDIVVSDIMMPVMNGLELCKEMKADIELSHIPRHLPDRQERPRQQNQRSAPGCGSIRGETFLFQLPDNTDILPAEQPPERTRGFLQTPVLPGQQHADEQG